MNENKENIIVDRSFDFALRIVKFYKFMNEKKEYVLSRQLLRAGTSIGANVEEAQAAQTKKDFTAKMCVASKEARETRYWLNLIRKSDLFPQMNKELDSLLSFSNELILILTKIVKTSQNI
jgi:four helix bundle protein